MHGKNTCIRPKSMSFSMSSFAWYFNFKTVTAEKGVSHKYITENGNNTFTALADRNGYFCRHDVQDSFLQMQRKTSNNQNRTRTQNVIHRKRMSSTNDDMTHGCFFEQLNTWARKSVTSLLIVTVLQCIFKFLGLLVDPLAARCRPPGVLDHSLKTTELIKHTTYNKLATACLQYLQPIMGSNNCYIYHKIFSTIQIIQYTHFYHY